MQLALWVILPNISVPGLDRVPAERIKIVSPAYNDQVRRITETSALADFSQQSSWPAGTPAQFHFKIDGSIVRNHGLTIYVPGAAVPTRISVNGVPSGYSEKKAIISLNRWPHLLLTDIPESQFEGGLNRLDIIQYSRPQRIGLEAVYISNTAAGDTAIERMQNYREALSSMLFAAGWIALLVSLIGLLLGVHKFGYFGGTVAAVSVLLQFLPSNRWLSVTAGGLSEIAISASLAAGLILLLLALYRMRSFPSAVIFGLAGAALLAAVWAVFSNLSPQLASYPVLSANYGFAGLIPLLAVGLPLLIAGDVQRYIRLLGQARQDISMRDMIIEQKDQALHNEIRRKAIVEERQRFVRDVHDGIGGQLLSLLLRVRSGMAKLEDVEQEIQGGITDLRLVVDSLDHVGTDLAKAMSTFYVRSSQQLAAANIEVKWRQSEELGQYQLDARQILNIYRIMQEAVSNSVKHSAAQRLEISAQPAPGSADLEITITDNGCGFAIDELKAGKGVKNMRARAGMLGAKLTLRSNENGTVVALRLPADILTKDPATHFAPPQK